MPRAIQNLIYVIIILIMIPFYMAMKPGKTFTPHGIILPATTETKPAINPDQVTLYRLPPSQYVIGGVIRVSIHKTRDAKNLEAKNIAYAKQLAAKAGYNGILVTAVGNTQASLNPLDETVLWGKVIEVNGG